MRTNLLGITLLAVGTVAVEAASRTFTFRNLCDEPIWLAATGGSSRNKGSPTSTTCGGDGDCFEGTHCIQTGPIS